MLDISSSGDEILVESEARGQGLKYLPHWPPVNIVFEDIVYTIENGIDSKYPWCKKFVAELRKFSSQRPKGAIKFDQFCCFNPKVFAFVFGANLFITYCRRIPEIQDRDLRIWIKVWYFFVVRKQIFYETAGWLFSCLIIYY